MSAPAYCPAVVVQQWRSRSALLNTFSFLRGEASRLALCRGHLVPLPPMPPTACRAGAFGVIMPTRTGFMWLLSFTHWLDDSPARAAGTVATLTAPGGEMEGREMVVFPLAQADMASPPGKAASSFAAALRFELEGRQGQGRPAS